MANFGDVEVELKGHRDDNLLLFLGHTDYGNSIRVATKGADTGVVSDVFTSYKVRDLDLILGLAYTPNDKLIAVYEK